MLDYSEPVARLIDEFKRLPGIGGKSAQRLAFYILRRPTAEVENFEPVGDSQLLDERLATVSHTRRDASEVALFNAHNASATKDATSIPATFLRVTVAV